MAQSYVNLKDKNPDACFALYNEKEVVGFTKIVYVPKDVQPYHFKENSYMIDAIMIDEKHQGLGYVKAAVVQILKYIESQPFGKATSVKLLCHEENQIGLQMYEKLGFNQMGSVMKKKGKFLILEKVLNF